MTPNKTAATLWFVAAGLAFIATGIGFSIDRVNWTTGAGGLFCLAMGWGSWPKGGQSAPPK